jgi:hypothetical protein
MRRMKISRPHITKCQIDEFAASALLWLAWLAGVIFLIGAPRRSRRLRRMVKRCERWVECIILLHALERHGMRPHFHGVGRAAARIGFRRQCGAKRLFMRSARIRARNGCLPERVQRLLDALADPEPPIARFLKRLAHGLHAARLIVVAPPAWALGDDAPLALNGADTS